MKKIKHGFIQVYTGNGKGKTTAAFGLALRAAGADLNVYIIQFCKQKNTSEYKILSKTKNIKISTFGGNKIIIEQPVIEDFANAEKAWNKAVNAVNSNKFNIVILDELNIALYHKLIDINTVCDFLKNKPANVEIIITGRYAGKKILQLADLITEMKQIKHYYVKKKNTARRGIEF